MLDPSDRAFWTGLVVMSLSLVSALATYMILTGLTTIAPRDEIVLGVLAVNVVLIVAMITVIARHFIELARAWRDKVAGARLHVRIVALFSVIAALPAILLAVAATVTFSRSLDGWFSTRTRAIIDNSLEVAKAYLDEHGQVIRTDIVNMARDLDGAADQVKGSAESFKKLVLVQAGLRDLPAAYVIDAKGSPIVAAIEDETLPYRAPPTGVIRQAEEGQIPLLMPSSGNRVGAVAKLVNHPGLYLYVARGVNPKVVGQLRLTEQNVDEYKQLRRSRGGLKIAHGLMYLMISMTALLAAVWIGLWFAGRFVAPIRRLIGAAQQVSKGNLLVELPERKGEGDLRRLSQTFNQMTRELKGQRDALVSANEEMAERRRFIEAVLSGVSAGVIGLDSEHRITLVSRSAEKLLGVAESDVEGRQLAEALPLLMPLIERDDTQQGIKARAPHQVTVQVGNEERTLAVQITHEAAGEGDVGSVVTLDDITDLVVAQRSSAWADVARRIAHEIKNPLTPIQLSAERIRRKYGRQIADDKETFDKLTQTIERQADHIKSMVDEFASFARMPKPQMEPLDLREAVQEPVVLFRESHPAIDFTLEMPPAPVIVHADRRLVSQAVTNLVKNATEAIQSLIDAKSAPAGYRGRIETRVCPGPDRVAIEVIDNGIGLPKQNRARLLEPYVTTRAKGTGLGLAIVQKITEQHQGALALEDAPPAPGRERGALLRLTLPLRLNVKKTTEAAPSAGELSAVN